MRHPILAPLILAAIATTFVACEKKGAAFAAQSPFGKGRFAAVGLYGPGQAWRLQESPQSGRPADPALATLNDDDTILVVLDSTTGEIRQCGNMSGRCLAMNPWTRPVDGVAAAPAVLTEHPGDALRREPPATVEVRRKAG